MSVSASRVKTHPRIGRTTYCDACERVKPDCLWVKRTNSATLLCLCQGCRSASWAKDGLEHADVEYPEVAL